MTQKFEKHPCVFSQAGAPSHTGSVRELAYLAAVMKIKSQSDGKPQCRACSLSYFHSAQNCTLHTGKPRHSEWWRQSWSLKKEWTAPCYPKVKGSEDSKGLLSCRGGKPQNEPPYSQTGGSPNLLLHSELPVGSGLGYDSSWNVSFALTPTPPLSCTLLLCQFLFGDFLWQSLAQILGLKYISSNTPPKGCSFEKWKMLLCIPVLILSRFTFFLFCFKFYWSTVTFQHCISFFFTLNPPHVYMYTYIPSRFGLSSLGHHRVPWALQ